MMALAETDSLADIERLAAQKFHVLINDYRSSNDLDTLLWNEVLWISSRNHCVWMMENDQLSHYEWADTKYFTGSDPAERYKSASRGRTEGNYTAENILYHFASSGAHKNRIAQQIAETSFLQWKNSPGHNASMLSPKSSMHGVAFLISKEGKVWGADLFGFCEGCVFGPPTPKPILAKKYQLVKSSATGIDKAELQVVLDELQNELLDSLYTFPNNNSAEIPKRKKALEKAAQNYLKASIKSSSSVILKNKSHSGSYTSFTSKEFDAHSVVRNNPKNKTNAKIRENEIRLEKEASYFTLEETLSDIRYFLGKSATTSENFREVGYAVAVQKKKGKVIVTVLGVFGE